MVETLRVSNWWRNPDRFKVLLQLPLMIVMNFTAMIPFALTWYVGMTNWLPQLTIDWWKADFIGPLNFIKVIPDQLFLNAIGRTLLFSAVCVPIEFLLGFLLAYVFMGDFFGKKFFVLVAIVPMMVVPAAGGYVFYLMFIASGPVNGLLNILGFASVPFLTTIKWAYVSIILADIWQWTPFIFLIMSAALLGLPQEPINAAYVLGASKWHTFRSVVLPMLKRPTMIALILRGVESFKLFDYPFMMTGGGPGYSTQTISMHLYEAGFRYLKYGPTAAQSLVILLVMGIVGFYVVKPLRAAQRGK